MLNVAFKYLMSYIVSITIYVISFFYIIGLNAKLINYHDVLEELCMIFIVLEFIGVLSAFNYRSYKRTLKDIEIGKAKKIFRKFVIFNFIVSAIFIVMSYR